MSNILVRDRLRGQAPLAIARVVAKDCIGCALCIKACPFDAITGARGWLHEVIEEACVGCELCVPKCPVDCIVMETQNHALEAKLLAAAKERLVARRGRLRARAKREKEAFEIERKAIKERLKRHG